MLSWRQLRLAGLEVGVAPFSLHLAGVELAEPALRVVVRPDGRLNLLPPAATASETTAAAPPPAPAPSAAEAKATTARQLADIRIQRVAVQDGQFEFVDERMSPPFALRLSEFGGLIEGLSGLTTEAATVDLQGRFEGVSKLTIKGRVNPLCEPLLVDLKVACEALGLTPFSPYTGKYLGHQVAKGALSLDLRYDIANQELKAENGFVLDQFALGSNVASEDAVKLPWGLILAVLQDRHGKIALSIPVQGRLDDPEFRLGPAIVKTLLGLLTKVAFSPFAALGALAGGKADLQQALFVPGSDSLAPAAQETLAGLRTVLAERPALQLEIVPEIAAADRPALVERRYEEHLRQPRFAALLRAGKAPASIAEVTLSPEERLTAVKQAFAALPTALREPLGRHPTPEVMEATLRRQITVPDDALRTVAVNRARACQQALASDGQVAADRLFVLEPKAGEAADPRVIFQLR
jgi:hypothetical protein